MTETNPRLADRSVFPDPVYKETVLRPLFDGAKLIDMSIDDLTDKSLYESLKDLISIATSTPNNRHSNILPSNGSESYEIMVKAVISGTKTAYLLFTVMQVVEEEGGS